ncbi:MAG: hypothetical protein HYX65_01010 [Gemmatimonadetes bacterium]|nr:hypothetical protein [Gemmatimonadota bacterium]
MFALLLTGVSACAGRRLELPTPPDAAPAGLGVMVMAHGGSPEWNREVLGAVSPLAGRYPIEVSFGMAESSSMQAAVRRLEARGARRIVVVRLFISGQSFLDRTEQILGLRAGATRTPPPERHAGLSGPHEQHGPDMRTWRIQSASTFALNTSGLADADEVGTVLLDRARALSRDPVLEDVLILAHGPGDDAENARWIESIEARARAVREGLPFRRVMVMTLREDWPDKRADAEARARAFVQRAAAERGVAIVLPFRVQGFGPYAEVLRDLPYRSDGLGLIPHPVVTQWIEAQIRVLERTPFRAPLP